MQQRIGEVLKTLAGLNGKPIELEPMVARLMRRHETDPAFLMMLDAFHDQAVTDYLRALAKSPSVEIRRQVASNLANRAHRVPRELLLSFVGDRDDEVSTFGIVGLRRLLELPLSIPTFSADRPTMIRLFKRRFAADFKPAPLDKTMPPEVDAALALRKESRSAEAADRLKTIAKRASLKGDDRTEAIALHRAGDAYADDRDCNSAVDAYWQALALHELRGDLHFAAVASNDLGLLWFKCGWHLGSWAPGLFEYTVAIRRHTHDEPALRQALNNYSTSLLGNLLLDDAKPVIAEALALSKKLGDPVGERKAYTNEADRLALYCTELARLRVRQINRLDGRPWPEQCQLQTDGTARFKPEVEAQIRAVLAQAVDAAKRTGVDNATLCTTWPWTVQFLCDWLPPQSP